MENCPLSGLSCPHKKCIHVTECGPKYTLDNVKNMCVDCGSSYIEPVIENVDKLVSDILGTFLKDKPGEQMLDLLSLKKKEASCPKCGQTMDGILTGGRLGCAECYKYFNVAPLLIKIHGTAKHLGKRPSSKNVQDLEKALKEAISKENYEEAANLKAKIKESNK